MPIFNLKPQAQQFSVNVTEDVISGGVVTSVAVTAVSTLLLLANPARAKLSIYNNSENTCLIAHSSVVDGATFEFPIPGGHLWYPDVDGRYLGDVVAIAPNGDASLQVTEFTLV